MRRGRQRGLCIILQANVEILLTQRYQGSKEEDQGPTDGGQIGLKTA